MTQTVFIFGATGYMGSHLAHYFLSKNWTVISNRTDIRNYNEVFEILKKTQPDVVINAAGVTGRPNVDACEDDKARTLSVNVGGAINVASACDALDLYCVHLSSGCIYDGNCYFTEDDEPNFDGSFYSRTKALSEKALKEFDILQLRIRIPIEGKSNSKNVIDKLLKYEKIISVENSFTIVEDFLPASEELIAQRQTGIFNMTNMGSMDHEYLMTQYKHLVDPSFNFTIMSLDELHGFTKAKRSNCTLNTDKREMAGAHMPPIKERIKDILHLYKASKAH